MKIYFLYTLIFFALFSCKKNTTSLDDLFEKTELISHNILINESDYLMGSTGKMLIVDSILITLDYNNEHMLHIFDIKSNKYINNLGVKGQGPNEFLHLSSLIHSSSKNFLSYDLLDNSLKLIDIDSLLNGGISYRKVLSFNSISNSSILPTKYNNYVGFGLYSSNMFKLIDQEGNDMESFLNFPIENGKIDRNMDYRNIALGYQGVLAIHPNRDKLVYVSIYGTILGIYKIKKDSILQDFLLVNDYPQFIAENNGGGMSSPLTRDAISAFRDVYTTEKYIYTLYSGKKVSELHERAFEAQNIYVFDWEGNPIVKLSSDIPINNISVPANNQKIFAISNLPEPTLVEFDINL